MDSQQIIEIERTIAAIKADITILEKTIDNLKNRDIDLVSKVDKSKEDILKIQFGVHTDISKVNGDINILKQQLIGLDSDLTELTQCSHDIEKKVVELSTSPLFSLTSNLDLKKIIVIITIIASVLTSPTIVTNFLNSNGPSDVKLDKLIELLEDGKTP